ncbi:MAG: hypothetical protein ACR2M1_09800 [Gemmatimonadaceae bacterium]
MESGIRTLPESVRCFVDEAVFVHPGEKHWHGASPSTPMTHIAIQEALDGKAVDWMEKVSDDQYQPDPSRKL